MNLEQKQVYYEYSGGWSYKEPPSLGFEIHRRLREIDRELRLIWGGVAIYRDSPEGNPINVRGNRDAMKMLYGRLTARYIDTRVQQFAGFAFKLKNGREKVVMREDLVPVKKRALAVAKFEYVDYGRLRWFLVRHLTPEQLVEAGIYDKDDVDLPRYGDYIWRLTVETPDGRYWEPDHGWLEMVGKSVHESLNRPLSELYYEDHELLLERDRLRAEMEDNETCISPHELLKLTIDTRN